MRVHAGQRFEKKSTATGRSGALVSISFKSRALIRLTGLDVVLLLPDVCAVLPLCRATTAMTAATARRAIITTWKVMFVTFLDLRLVACFRSRCMNKTPPMNRSCKSKRGPLGEWQGCAILHYPEICVGS